jgi:high-affinity iron transporter
MKRLVPTAGILLLGLWACDAPGLPAEYRDVEVPESRLSSTEARGRGRALFLQHCAICHGERADGQGRRRNLSPRAADFTDPAWRARMTPERAFYVIREGIRGTPMAAWKVLSEDDTWDLVAYVLSLQEP